MTETKQNPYRVVNRDGFFYLEFKPLEVFGSGSSDFTPIDIFIDEVAANKEAELCLNEWNELKKIMPYVD